MSTNLELMLSEQEQLKKKVEELKLKNEEQSSFASQIDATCRSFYEERLREQTERIVELEKKCDNLKSDRNEKVLRRLTDNEKASRQYFQELTTQQESLIDELRTKNSFLEIENESNVNKLSVLKTENKKLTDLYDKQFADAEILREKINEWHNYAIKLAEDADFRCKNVENILKTTSEENVRLAGDLKSAQKIVEDLRVNNDRSKLDEDNLKLILISHFIAISNVTKQKLDENTFDCFKVLPLNEMIQKCTDVLTDQLKNVENSPPTPSKKRRRTSARICSSNGEQSSSLLVKYFFYRNFFLDN